MPCALNFVFINGKSKRLVVVNGFYFYFLNSIIEPSYSHLNKTQFGKLIKKL